MPLPPLPIEDLDLILEKSRDDLEQLRGGRLFLTGGTGFFGIWLLESFSDANQRLSLNANITVLSRSPESFLCKFPHLRGAQGITFIQGDIKDFNFPEGKFQFIIHAATDTAMRSNAGGGSKGFQDILAGTKRVLEFAGQCGVEKLLLTSSGAVYGRQPSDLERIPETYPGAPDPMQPAAYYGEAKRVSEFLCASHARDIGYEAKISRCFAFVGPHLPLNGPYAIGNFIRDGVAGVPIRIAGDGTPLRSYLYASDLIVWLWRILFRGLPFRPYNVGSPEYISISSLAGHVASATKSQHPVEIARPAIQGQPISRYVPDTTFALKDLGLIPWTSLSDAITKTVTWCHSNS